MCRSLRAGKVDSKEYLLIKRLDAALRARKEARDAAKLAGEELTTQEFKNVRCAVCLQNIPRYIGLEIGIICSDCYESSNCCTRVMPLAITRSTMNER